MPYRIPGNEPKEYPEDDKEKVNTVMNYLVGERASPILMDKILMDLGWKIDEIDQLSLGELLTDTGHVDVNEFGSLGKLSFKIKTAAVIGITDHGSYKIWQAANEY